MYKNIRRHGCPCTVQVFAYIVIIHCAILYVHTHKYIEHNVHTYIHAYIYAYVNTCLHTYMHACMYTYIHKYRSTCIHTGVRTYRRTYIHTYIRQPYHYFSCVLQTAISICTH